MKKAYMSFLIAGLASAAVSIGAFSGVSGNKAAYTPATELKWSESGIPGGVTISPVQGDISKGEHMTYVRFPAGTKVPTHVHNASYIGVVLSGNMRHPVKGKPETDLLLPAGSHWSIPANVEHETECLPGVECIALMYQKDRFEFTLRSGKAER